MSDSLSIKNILVVEDNQGDVDLLKAAFEELGHHFNLHVEQDGEAAIKYIKQISGEPEASLPDLIFLDINIPRYDGHEVLETIRGLDELKSVPVLIYTSSTKPSDVDTSYETGATAHIQKSLDFDDTVKTIRKILTVYGKIYDTTDK